MNKNNIVKFIGIIILYLFFTSCTSTTHLQGPQITPQETCTVEWDTDADYVTLQYLNQGKWEDVFTVENKPGKNTRTIKFKIGSYQLKVTKDDLTSYSKIITVKINLTKVK